ncbi:hypothetical protein ASG87_15745 [Frateuria sp. Soil773]|uniref:hypothetical protein n=1 Tax=Frateuria sp. Soil773 TaxID=1736407 RepID=UPI0006F73C6A|nr:hypothetical protein [Frateuria sp. Soil773]KRE96775.1 hypothetical protein ASG87_15745 [Frateuria sp. Soil773]
MRRNDEHEAVFPDMDVDRNGWACGGKLAPDEAVAETGDAGRDARGGNDLADAPACQAALGKV